MYGALLSISNKVYFNKTKLGLKELFLPVNHKDGHYFLNIFININIFVYKLDCETIWILKQFINNVVLCHGFMFNELEG